MPTLRLSPKEVQVDDTIYAFERVVRADEFEACVATVDVAHCLRTIPPDSERPGSEPHADPEPSEPDPELRDDPPQREDRGPYSS